MKDDLFEMISEIMYGKKVEIPSLCEAFHNQTPVEVVYKSIQGQIKAHNGCVLEPSLSMDEPELVYDGHALVR